MNTFALRKSIKGEITLIVSGKSINQGDSLDEIESEIKKRLLDKKIKKSDLARDLALEFGLGRKEIYDQILKISDV